MAKQITSKDVAQPKLQPATDVFISTMADVVKEDDIYSVIKAQRHMLSRFEKTNEMLLTFNALSSQRYEAMFQEFKKNTALLYDMKKDLDTVFRKIRTLKAKLSKQYPDAFAACSDVYNVLEEESEEEIADKQPAS
ncbi:kxDL motif-containing protein 1-like [Lingula anatina]|uniref:KxDL motif-containing protein 1-like n=1 Tax=Lingula anatina TaxID=7574 RepID=A0A1S3IQI6_LINAN|nr:kxDL motif-containing protein 1-like [Lingula anatina]|eukprot:XP_013400477.1 kxDL motif-containing protein 1-like [Lingula anatina]